MKHLSGRVAVITGAASGIGAAMAWRFARAGMKLVVSDLDAQGADRTVAALAEAGHEAIAARTDVSDPADVQALADLAYAQYGAVHLLCNNAGIVPGGRHRAVWEYPLEDWKWSLDVNLLGVVHGIRSFIPRMLAQRDEGHVLNTASVAGLVSGAGSVVYSAAKHAVVRTTEGLYAALNERGAPIGVTLLCPGLVNTRIYESERSRPSALRPEGGPAEEAEALKGIAEQLYANAISPDEVAELAYRGVIDNRLYVLTTESFDEAIADRMAAILARRNPDFASLLELSTREAAAREAVR